MVAITDRPSRVIESAHKILSPYELDPDLCLYSPQDNVDALANPRVAAWLRFVEDEYRPAATDARRILLFLPCTATKPYIASSEHRAINARLLAEGFEPVGPDVRLPEEIVAMHPDDDPRLFDLAPLRRGEVEICRVVMSEPLAFVPYEHMLTFDGGQSPAVSYDDPGLFEKRNNAVSPWRSDSTAEEVAPNRWRWGDNERKAYVEMHNAMAEALAHVLTRLDGAYDHTMSWVAPGLTHRSFCLARRERSSHGVVATKQVAGKRLGLIGVNDLLPERLRIDVLPSSAQCDDARARLHERLGGSKSATNAVFARGGCAATPLALPELLDVLVARLDAVATAETPARKVLA